LDRWFAGCSMMPNNPDKFLLVGGHLPLDTRYNSSYTVML
jgi:hypothetical protein